MLARIGKLEAPAEIGTISGEPWGYRNRTQLHLAGGEIGFFGTGSHHLVPVDRCPISSPRINEALAALRAMKGERRFPGFITSLELFTNETEVQVNVLESGRPVSKRFFDWCAEKIPGYAADAIEYPVGAAAFRVHHKSFFQVNRFLIEPLIAAALEGAEGESALDLYSGVGLFSIALARRFRSVTAVETEWQRGARYGIQRPARGSHGRGAPRAGRGVPGGGGERAGLRAGRSAPRRPGQARRAAPAAPEAAGS